MQPTLTISGLILLALATAGAQVASHAPTVLQPQPGTTPVNSALPAPDKPVALVNGSVLTGADLLREEYAIFPYARQHNGVPKELAGQIHDGALRMLIFEELVYQEALRQHLNISATKMTQAESQFEKQFPTPDDFQAFLQNDFHGSRRLLNEKIRRSLLIDQFLKNEVESRSVISDADARAWYDKNPARFEHPESYTFQTISVLPPAHATADQMKEGRRRAEQALLQAKQTKTAEEFGLLAEKLSDDDYRVMMGQHKPVPVEQLAPQVLKSLQSMHAGDVSDLIQIEQAYTIVRLGAHTPAGKTKFEDVKAELESNSSSRREISFAPRWTTG